MSAQNSNRIHILSSKSVVPDNIPCGSAGKQSAYNVGDRGWEDTLEKGTATHSSILAWRIPWTL